MADNLLLLGAGRSGTDESQPGDKILMETGDFVLLENGDKILIE